VLLAGVAIVAVGFDVTPASAQPKRQYDDRGRVYYGPNGPNVSYQQGPRTRIYVTKRSWLDARHRGATGRPQVQRLRIPAGDRVPIVRAREQQPPDTTDSRSTRRRTWADISSGSRCID